MKKENIFCPVVITLQGHWRSKEVVAQSACVVFSYHPKSEKKKIRFFHKICYILSFTYYKYLCPSFSLISRFPTNGSGNTNKMRQKKSCQNTASKKRKKERKKYYKCTTKFSSIQWVSVSLKKFFRNSRSAVGLCNIIVNCQVKIAEVFLSSAVQYYLLLSCFYFCSSKFKFKETHSIEILGQ